MRARLFNNGAQVSANSFVARFVGGVCSGIAASLKAPRPRKSITLDLKGGEISLELDSTHVKLDRNQGFAGALVRDTVQGMVRSLKGIDVHAATEIVVDVEEQP